MMTVLITITPVAVLFPTVGGYGGGGYGGGGHGGGGHGVGPGGLVPGGVGPGGQAFPGMKTSKHFLCLICCWLDISAWNLPCLINFCLGSLCCIS